MTGRNQPNNEPSADFGSAFADGGAGGDGAGDRAFCRAGTGFRDFAELVAGRRGAMVATASAGLGSVLRTLLRIGPKSGFSLPDFRPDPRFCVAAPSEF